MIDYERIYGIKQRPKPLYNHGTFSISFSGTDTATGTVECNTPLNHKSLAIEKIRLTTYSSLDVSHEYRFVAIFQFTQALKVFNLSQFFNGSGATTVIYSTSARMNLVRSMPVAEIFFPNALLLDEISKMEIVHSSLWNTSVTTTMHVTFDVFGVFWPLSV